ncbi:unnamed protein product [Clonostachys byssicola]|uniref:NAD-dependent epimerase/dehydratase domain-containing protein n=1 Tax=Clonostachys byssicola TaxID=160290 RepID=A0A9N9UBX5_9HYPO|nr:unnamed protein product [Clonostachys byssicola]
MAATFLITGATGLIGFHVLLAVLAQGHRVQYVVRSAEKAQMVSSNPAVERLAPGDCLVPIVIPDLTVADALDAAMQGVTHVIHCASPVPAPSADPRTDVCEPTIMMSANLLSAALKTPSVQRVVLTSSIVANLGVIPPQRFVSATTRAVLPPMPNVYKNVFEAYLLGKVVEMRNTDEFVKSKSPHFSVSYVVPGYVYGRNELMTGDAQAMKTRNSSNNLLMLALTGGKLPFPVHNGFAHVDDLGELYLRVALLDAQKAKEERLPQDFGMAVKVDYAKVFSYVKAAYPKAVKEGIFKKGNLPSFQTFYDSDAAKKVLGRDFRSFESAVVDVAGQYLERLGKEKA